VFAAIGYALTQILKIFIMASCLPTATDEPLLQSTAAVSSSGSAALPSARSWSVIEEACKSLISLIEIWGVGQILSYTPSLSKFSPGTRILAVSLGLGGAESLLKYFLPIIWGARAQEFSWRWIEMGLESNVSLMGHAAFVAMVWLKSRHDLSSFSKAICWMTLVAMCIMPTIDNYLTLVHHLDSWSLLGVHGAVAVVMAVLAKIMLSSYLRQRATSQTNVGAAKKGQ